MSNDIALLRKQLTAQHALHGLFGEVFEELGGKQFLLDAAENNPRWFITTMCKMTPNLMPQAGIQGDVNISMHAKMVPTNLDTATLDEQGRVIDNKE